MKGMKYSSLHARVGDGDKEERAAPFGAVYALDCLRQAYQFETKVPW